ncbi:diguanylate cyclase [Piscinibacter aquaticus]|uniref:Diguanylate cyclase n=1 Tax=Piscinibacter aquaticus TaxID=392597 RepID=A0A5C6TY77_9BURK|nr:diguanylate cyclase [Piscinibacter aquaticus]
MAAGAGPALLALATGRAWAMRSVAGVLAAASATLVGAYGYAMLLLPGLFRTAPVDIPVGEGVAIALLAVGVTGLFVPLRSARAATVGHAVAAVLVASIVALALGRFLATDAAVPLTSWHEVAMLAVMAALAAALWAALRLGNAPAEAAPRAARPAGDLLTGLPTRQFFEERLASAARRCDAKRGKLAVLFIDLDGFKPVNDTYGHACGDRVLEQVGQRLRSITRGADVAARVGGDEFLLLMPAISSQDSVTRVAKAMIELLSRPYKVDEREISISCSVGIALYPDGCKANKLIARADAAMYAAKRAGGTRHAYFSPEMDHAAKQDFEMVRDLRRAIAGNELELYFQPKIDARSGRSPRPRHCCAGTIPSSAW